MAGHLQIYPLNFYSPRVRVKAYRPSLCLRKPPGTIQGHFPFLFYKDLANTFLKSERDDVTVELHSAYVYNIQESER